MRLRIIPVTFAALLSATGCVSVSGAPHSPVPSSAADPVPADAQAPAAPVPVRPSAHEELASTAPEEQPPSGRDGGADAKARGATTGGATTGGDSARRPDRLPARKAAQPTPPRRSPAKARPPRGGTSDGAGGPQPGYGMPNLCEESDGVTDPALTALCRQTYGR
ncbi:hypothetical protein V1460_14020 [Streptomyces sp. SCSIO 30461]|uniref:hypothetical protein n=1 Tax=Streptomyces sp. SCSIO 30461 TaxID=3118085 RepID=UPI0030CD8693